MRTLTVLALFCATGPLLRAGDGPKYPLWDGKESVAEYARRARLEPTLTIDLGESHDSGRNQLSGDYRGREAVFGFFGKLMEAAGDLYTAAGADSQMFDERYLLMARE